MESAGQKPLVVWLLNISVVLLTVLWLFPTLGLFVSSFRTSEQITASGWWSSMFSAEQTVQLRVADPDDFREETEAGVFVVKGTIFGEELSEVNIDSWGTSSRALDAHQAGDTVDLGEGETITLNPDGSYLWQGDDDQISGRAQRLFVNATVPPEFTLQNYNQVLFDEENSEGMLKAFFNTLTVVIPASDHSDPDRGLCGLCAGLDGFPRTGIADCRRGGAVGGAAATGADPAVVVP